MTERTQQDPAARIAELEEELRATRRDHHDKLAALAKRAEGSGTSRTIDMGLYELLLGQERERQRLEVGLNAEYHERLRVEAARDAEAEAARVARADRDALISEHDRLAREFDATNQWALELEERVRVVETSLAWRLGRAILDPLKRIPGARFLARRVKRSPAGDRR